MKIDVLQCTPNADKLIERIGRTCYDSTHLIKEDSAKRFISNLISRGHDSVLEHGVITFHITDVSRACYDKETEVLTANGWKYFSELTSEDLVATRNNEGYLEFNKPDEFIKYKYSGKLKTYKSQNLNLCVTPDHNLLLKKHDVRIKKDFTLYRADSLNCNRYKSTKEVKIKEEIKSPTIKIDGYSFQRKNNCGGFFTKTWPDLYLDRNTFIKFLAWYLAEGSVYHDKGEGTYKISIAQSSLVNQKKRERIRKIISDLGFTPTMSKNDVAFKSCQLGVFLKTLGHSIDKYIPYNEFTFTKTEAQEFLEEYILGDGCTDKNKHSKIYTISKKLADQIYNLCFIAGYTASLSIDNRIGDKRALKTGQVFYNKNICYNISISKLYRNLEPLIKRDKHESEIAYDDNVYCVSVKNHVIFVRRHGIALWCGNCTHQLVRHRIGCSYTQRSQRYCREDQFEYVKPTKLDAAAEEVYEKHMRDTARAYNDLLLYGLKPEDARMVLPNACCTEITVTMNFRALRHFAKLRCDKHAQWEIRYLAESMLELAYQNAPACFEDLYEQFIRKI